MESEIQVRTAPTWPDWVSASRTRNWCLRNPLQDWLELHGENAGFERDPEPDPRTDFREFIFAKGSEFEAAVVRLLARQTDVSVIGSSQGRLEDYVCTEIAHGAAVAAETAVGRTFNLYFAESTAVGVQVSIVREHGELCEGCNAGVTQRGI